MKSSKKKCYWTFINLSPLAHVKPIYWQKVLVKESASETHSVLSYSLRIYPWTIQSIESLGQNTGVGSCSVLQGIFLTQESNRGLPTLQADSSPAELQNMLHLLQGHSRSHMGSKGPDFPVDFRKAFFFLRQSERKNHSCAITLYIILWLVDGDITSWCHSG